MLVHTSSETIEPDSKYDGNLRLGANAVTIHSLDVVNPQELASYVCRKRPGFASLTIESVTGSQDNLTLLLKSILADNPNIRSLRINTAKDPSILNAIASVLPTSPLTELHVALPLRGQLNKQDYAAYSLAAHTLWEALENNTLLVAFSVANCLYSARVTDHLFDVLATTLIGRVEIVDPFVDRHDNKLFLTDVLPDALTKLPHVYDLKIHKFESVLFPSRPINLNWKNWITAIGNSNLIALNVELANTTRQTSEEQKRINALLQANKRNLDAKELSAALGTTPLFAPLCQITLAYLLPHFLLSPASGDTKAETSPSALPHATQKCLK